MFEVEQKYRVDCVSDVAVQLEALHAIPIPRQVHEDIYYAHPSRDFRETGEALRIRKINSVASVTYKGPKVPAQMKVRKELEWSLGSGDLDGSQIMELFQMLGFAEVATVRKKRDLYQLPDDLTVVLDEVDQLGNFAEIERIVTHESQIEPAMAAIGELGMQIGLKKKESQSYLGMLLQLPSN